MKLEGSCHCSSVVFSLESLHPYPFNLCYCTVCRKTAGGGGFAINLGGDYESLKVTGQEHIQVYQAIIDGVVSPAERRFCRRCATALWVWDPRWPALIHPFASAIDTPLPPPPERTHLMLNAKATWVTPQFGDQDQRFETYPTESIVDWHKRLKLECP